VLVGDLENRIASDSAEGGHVEDGPDAGSPAPDGAGSPHLAGVPVEGRYADKGGDLPAVELAQLRHLGDERSSQYGADAGDGAEQFIVCAPGGALADQAVEVIR